MKACCMGLENMMANAGMRGLSVIVVREEKGIGFRLQSRGCDVNDIDNLRSGSNDPALRLNIVTQTGMLYCPFCGEKLSNLVDRSFGYFNDLVDKYRQYES